MQTYNLAAGVQTRTTIALSPPLAGHDAAVRHPGLGTGPRPGGKLNPATGLPQDGVVLSWRSADPELVVQEVGGPIAGKTVVDVSAGKYRTAAVTSEGDIFMWEGWSKPLEAGAGTAPTPRRGGGGSGAKEAAQQQATALGKSPDAPRCASRVAGLTAKWCQASLTALQAPAKWVKMQGPLLPSAYPSAGRQHNLLQ